ncbi:MAG: nitronate monooxygenase [Actinobacteria bacterium]|nr:nitronate monooxygenase [Actinomycetota bacterium]
MVTTSLMQRLGIDAPVIQAPMGGGPTTPELVAAVTNAGGIGSVAGGYLDPDTLRREIAAVRQLTDGPFAVNVFAPLDPDVTPDAIEVAIEVLAPYRRELGLEPRPALGEPGPAFSDHLDVLVETAPPVVSFTFGLLPPDAVRALHDVGCLLVGTATSVEEAVALVHADVDVVCAQGSEAGAHRGTFLTDPVLATVGLVVLVPAVTDAVDVPVVAAGGIMDGRGVASVLALGAQAAQLGTAFLRCPQAGTNATHRAALAAAGHESTVVTSALTGRAARTIANRLTRELADRAVPAYPVMNALTAELRRVAAARGREDLMSLWAGQGVARGTELDAGELVRRLAEETERAIAGLGVPGRP